MTNRLEGSLGALTNETWLNSWRGMKLVTSDKNTNSFATEEKYLEELRRAFYQFRNVNSGWTANKPTNESMKINENQ